MRRILQERCEQSQQPIWPAKSALRVSNPLISCASVPVRASFPHRPMRGDARLSLLPPQPLHAMQAYVPPSGIPWGYRFFVPSPDCSEKPVRPSPVAEALFRQEGTGLTGCRRADEKTKPVLAPLPVPGGTLRRIEIKFSCLTGKGFLRSRPLYTPRGNGRIPYPLCIASSG